MHSFASCLVHVVFSTKGRRPWITRPLQEHLWPYLGGIARNNKMKALKVGGVEDHVHVLLLLPATLPVSKAVQLLKGNSSKWIHEQFPDRRDFEWQVGYGAFCISNSGVADTVANIANQAAHHRRLTFQEEFASILKKHGIENEARMLD